MQVQLEEVTMKMNELMRVYRLGMVSTAEFNTEILMIQQQINLIVNKIKRGEDALRY